MFYVVNNHLNNLYVLSNKAVGPGKNPKLINVGPTSIPESRVRVTKRIYNIAFSSGRHIWKPPIGKLTVRLSILSC